MALSGQGRLEEALLEYRAAARLAPDDPQPLNNIGVDLTTLGRAAEAEAQLRRALEIAPGLAEIHANLGDALARQGRLPEAARSYRRALERLQALRPGTGDEKARSNPDPARAPR
jgi:Flp pilus assembly protein TadD